MFAQLFFVLLLSIAVADREAAKLLDQVDQATRSLDGFDLVLTVESKFAAHERADSLRNRFNNTKSRLHDVLSKEKGRIVEEEYTAFPGAEPLTLFQWHEDVEPSDGRQTDVNDVIMTRQLRMGGGNDYLEYIRPIVSNRDGIEFFRQHLQRGTLETTQEGTIVRFEVPLKEIAEFATKKANRVGLRLWIDTSRGYMPTKFEAYANQRGKEQLIFCTVSELSEISDGVWMPVRGQTTDYHVVGPHAGNQNAIVNFEVDVKKSHWNPKSVDSSFVAAVPRDGTLRGREGHVQDMGRGWQSWIDMPPDRSSLFATGWGSTRYWLIFINVIAILALVFILIRRRFRGSAT